MLSARVVTGIPKQLPLQSAHQTPAPVLSSSCSGPTATRRRRPTTAAAAAASSSGLFDPQPAPRPAPASDYWTDDGDGDPFGGGTDDEPWSDLDADLDVDAATEQQRASSSGGAAAELAPQQQRKRPPPPFAAELEATYGPRYADFDVRLYAKRREFNSRLRRQERRGGFPLDDSLPREGTWAKLGADFRELVRE
jgi:hypothetical protein